MMQSNEYHIGTIYHQRTPYELKLYQVQFYQMKSASANTGSYKIDDTIFHKKAQDNNRCYQVQFYQMKSASADTAASLRDWVTAAFQTMNEVKTFF